MSYSCFLLVLVVCKTSDDVKYFWLDLSQFSQETLKAETSGAHTLIIILAQYYWVVPLHSVILLYNLS